MRLPLARRKPEAIWAEFWESILNGVSLKFLKERLGHSDIATTIIYLRTIGALEGQEKLDESSLVSKFG